MTTEESTPVRSPPEHGPRGDRVLCVDLGMTTTQAVVLTDLGQIPLHDPVEGTPSWPSAVYAEESRILVGHAAMARKRLRPRLFRQEFKLELGEDTPLVFGGRSLTVRDLVGAYLQEIAAEAHRVLGDRVTNALLTMPAEFGPGDPRRSLLLDAAADAGLSTVELLPEPVAAALAPVIGTPFASDDLVLVYDLGGGTFDAALVRFTAADLEVLGSQSLLVAGRDVDAALVTVVREKLGDVDETGDEDADAAHRRRLDLLDLAVNLKVQVRPDYPAEAMTRDDRLVTLTDDELSERSTPLLERTLDCCRDLLARCQVRPDEVAAVLAVGGSVRSPVVLTAVEQLGIPVRTTEDPQQAVVRGACVWASRTPNRRIAPIPPSVWRRPLAWELPDGAAVLVEHCVTEAGSFLAGAALARVRDRNGALHQLVADQPGTVSAWQVAPGQHAVSGDWLLTVEVSGARRGSGRAKQSARNPKLGVLTCAAFLDHERLAVGGERGAAVLDLASGAIRLLCTGPVQEIVVDAGARAILVRKDDGVHEFPWFPGGLASALSAAQVAAQVAAAKLVAHTFRPASPPVAPRIRSDSRERFDRLLGPMSRHAAVSAALSLLAQVGPGDYVHIWSTPTMTLLGKIKLSPVAVAGTAHRLATMTFSPDGAQLAVIETGRTKVILWSLADPPGTPLPPAPDDGAMTPDDGEMTDDDGE